MKITPKPTIVGKFIESVTPMAVPIILTDTSVKASAQLRAEACDAQVRITEINASCERRRLELNKQWAPSPLPAGCLESASVWHALA